MTTIKSYTDLNQSHKLAEILPLESADMQYYADAVTKEDNPRVLKTSEVPSKKSMYYTPCWSLAALMDVLDRGALFKTPKGWACQSYTDFKAITSDFYNNPIDACVEIILEIHKQKNK